MNLWLLERVGMVMDEPRGFVVRASTENAARAQAFRKTFELAWWSPDDSTCTQLFYSGKAGIILEDHAPE